MSRARDLSKLGNINVLTADDVSSEVGIATTVPRSTLDVRGEIKVGTAIQAGTAGVLTATTFSGGLSGDITGSACTFTTGTFNGNVTIGGTLTYEDVTNIDSLGIVTARAGVNVSGGQLAVGVAYSVGAAGVATAAGFVGPLTGAVTGNADTATTATNVTVTANNSTDETVYPIFVDGATGSQGAESDTGLTYNPSDGNLTSTTFTGTASNASGATGDFSIADKIVHTGDTNTAIRFPSADNISFETGGTERIRIQSDGTVGFGTVVPVARVFEAFTSDTSTPSLTWQGGNPGQRFVNEGSELKFGLTSYSPYAYFIQANTSGSGQRQITLNPMGGSVAIGVTDPPTASGLVAKYDSTFAPTLTWNAAGGHIIRDEGSELNFGLSSISPHPFFIQGRTSGSAVRQIALNPLGGNVAINTSIASNTLNLGDNAGVGIKFHNYTTNNSYYHTVESGDKVQSNVGGSGYYTWVTGGAEKLRLNNDGQISIRGTTTSFDTTGDLDSLQLYYETDSGQASIGPYSSGGTTHLSFYTNSGGAAAVEKLRITGAGNLEFKTSTQNAYVGLTTTSNAINLTFGGSSGTSPRMYLKGVGNGQSDAGDIFIAAGTGGLMQLRSAEDIRFEVNSDSTTAEALRITSAGRLGIGLTNPSAQFVIGGETNGDMQLTASDANTGESRLFIGGAEQNQKKCAIIFDPDGSGYCRGTLKFCMDGGADTSDVDTSGDHPRMVINRDGEVGVGTDNPESKFVVAANSASAQVELKRTNTNTTGAIGALNWTAMDGHSVANINAIGDGNDEGAHIVFKTTSAAAESNPYGTGTVERIRISSGGQIGIAGANYGTSGQVLTSGGSGGAPSWADAGGGAWEFVSSIENPNTSTVAFTGLTTSNTAAYKVVWNGANINSTNNRIMRCRIYLDGSLQTGSDYQDLSMFTELGSGTPNGSQGQRNAVNLSGQLQASKGYNGELTFPLKQRESGGVESMQAFYGFCVSENYANTIRGYHTNSYSSILNGIAFDSPDNYNVTDGAFYLYRLTRS